MQRPAQNVRLFLLLLIVLPILAACTDTKPPEALALSNSGGTGARIQKMGQGVQQFLQFAQTSYDNWRTESEVIRQYRARYEAEYTLDRRVAEHPYWIAETYMRTYQPGPEPRIFQTTTIYDRRGELIAQLNEEGRRTWVSLDEISPFLREAVVATEDSTFFENPGIDYPRLLAAFYRNRAAAEIRSGASTITMQLARHLFLDPTERFEQSYERKAIEYYLARDLTELYTKEEILEIYLNLVYFGHGAYGVEAAALTYFGKSAADLNGGEATLLAGLPQQPSGLDPFTNLEGARRRQRTVLNLMVRHGRIDPMEADRVYALPIQINDEFDRVTPNHAPHFVQYLSEVIDEQGLGRLHRSGYIVHATLDLEIQALAEETVKNHIAQQGRRRNMTNASLVAMQAETTEIVAMVGSADYDNAAISGQFNVALSGRQPGSTFKPIVYATALEHNLISPATILWDIPAVFTTSLGETFYAPTNYDKKFHGPVTARTALANSYNVPAVRLFSRVGVARAVDMAHAMGISDLNDPPVEYGPSLVLGSQDVKLIDMVGAYHTLANEGRYREPTPYQSIEIIGRPRITADHRQMEQAVSPETAFQVTSMLSDRQARRPMFGSAYNLTLSIPAAVKTGTTDGYRDNWTVGYSKYLVTGVWGGNSDGSPMRKSTGASGAAPMWRAFMQGLIDDPELAGVLGMPAILAEQPERASFEPTDNLALVIDCPSQIPCRAEGEYFQRQWLSSTGTDGPFSDSFATGFLRPLPTNSLLYCEDDRGNQAVDGRRIYSLAGSIDELIAAYDSQASAGSGVETFPASTSASRVPQTWRYPSEADAIYVPDSEKDRLRTIAYASSNRWLASVGPCDNLWEHTVTDGESWTTIAQRFGVTSSVLTAVNRQAPAVLRPGDRIVVPYGLPIYVDEAEPSYVVEEGDTWMGIARKLGVPFNALEAVNIEMIRPNYLLRIGDELRVPVITVEPRDLLVQRAPM